MPSSSGRPCGPRLGAQPGPPRLGATRKRMCGGAIMPVRMSAGRSRRPGPLPGAEAVTAMPVAVRGPPPKSRLTNQSGPGPSGRRRRKFTVTALESRPGPGRPGPGLAQHFDWQNRRRPGSGYIHGNSGLHAGTTCPRIPMLTFATEKLSTRIMMRLPSFVRAVLNELSCVGTQAGSRGFQGTLGSFTLDSESYKAHMQCEKI